MQENNVKPGKSVLIVDDDPDVLLMTEIFAQRFLPDYKVTVAKSLEAAIADIANTAEPHALIITDFGLLKNGNGGEEVVSKAKIRCPDTKVLVYSGFLTTERRSHVVDACPSADAFLAKPYRSEELKVIIQHLLSIRAKQGTEPAPTPLAE